MQKLYRAYVVPILMNLDNWVNNFLNRNSYFLRYQKLLMMEVGSCTGCLIANPAK